MKSSQEKKAVEEPIPWRKLVICGSIFFIAIYLIWAAVFMYRMDSEHGMGEERASRNIQGLYDLYVSSTPDINGRFSYGNQNASISIIVYTSARSDAFRVFMRDIFPGLETEFINTGKVNLYYKNHLTQDDIATQNENFVLAQALSCSGSMKKDKFFEFYMDLSEVSDLSAIPLMAEKHGVSSEEFLNCIKRAEFRDLSTDAAEVEAFGMSGVNPRFYIGIKGRANTVIDGVPSYTKLRRTITDRQTAIGDLI